MTSNRAHCRRQHHANSLFMNSRSLSPATSNLVAMRGVRVDR